MGEFTNSEQKKTPKYAYACVMSYSSRVGFPFLCIGSFLDLHIQWCIFATKFTNTERLIVFKTSICSR